MIDLTNDNHKRGVMILSSKDVRTVDKNLFNYKANMGVSDTTLCIIKSRIERLDIDPSIKDATLSDLNFVINNIVEANRYIDKARDVFR